MCAIRAYGFCVGLSWSFAVFSNILHDQGSLNWPVAVFEYLVDLWFLMIAAVNSMHFALNAFPADYLTSLSFWSQMLIDKIILLNLFYRLSSKSSEAMTYLPRPIPTSCNFSLDNNEGFPFHCFSKICWTRVPFRSESRFLLVLKCYVNFSSFQE